MSMAFLRVSGPGWDVDAFLRDHGWATTVPSWRSNEPRAGGIKTRAGFNFPITPLAANMNNAEAASHIGQWLLTNRGALEALGPAGAKAQLTVAVDVVGSGEFPPKSLVLGATDLALLGKCGIELVLTAYEQTHDFRFDKRF